MGEEKGCVFLSSCRSVEVGYGRLGNGRKNTQAKGKHKKRRAHIQESGLLFAAPKASPLGEQTGNHCPTPQN